MEMFKNVPMTLDELGRTDANLFFREGKAEGKAEGKNEEKNLIISSLFEDNFPIERIAGIVKLSMEEVESRLRKMNLIA